MDRSPARSRARRLDDVRPGAEYSAGEGRFLFFITSTICLEHQVAQYFYIDEAQRLWCLSKKIDAKLKSIEYVVVKGGRRQDQSRGLQRPVAPWPCYNIGLFPQGGGLFQHQLSSLRAMRIAEERNANTYGTLRGGVLADAPGLGKSITILALIISTAGTRPKNPAEFWNNDAVQSAWQSLHQGGATSILHSEFMAGLQAVLKFRNYYSRETKEYKAATELLDVANANFHSPEALLRYVRSFHLPGATPVEKNEIISDFEHTLALVKARLDRRGRSSYSASGSSQMQRLLAERLSRPCETTLLVVPDALLEQWFRFIRDFISLSHLAPCYGDGTGRGIVWCEGFGDMYDFFVTKKKKSERGRLDELPRAPVLRGALILVVSFSLMDRQARIDEQASRGSARSSSLTQMRFLRLVIDEGHELRQDQTAEKEVRSIQSSTPSEHLTPRASRLIHELFAERRWIVSGTPATGDIDNAQATEMHLKQIQHLLTWLRHSRYGSTADARLDSADKLRRDRSECAQRFRNEILEPFVARQQMESTDQNRARIHQLGESAREMLLSTLKDIVIRHQKSDLDLPKPIFKNTELLVRKEANDTEFSFQWRIDNAMADAIIKRLKKNDKQSPKIAVFSQHDADLESCAEVLYPKLGQSQIAEYHVRALGRDRAARELARFVRGELRTRRCPICGFMNQEERCERLLMEVEILDDGVATYRLRNHPLSFVARQRSYQLSETSSKRILIETDRILNAQQAMRIIDQDTTYADNWRAWSPGDILAVDLSTNPKYPKRPSAQHWLDWNVFACEDLAFRNNWNGPDWYFSDIVPSASDILMLDDDVDEDDLFQTPPEHSQVRVKLIKWAKCSQFHSSGRWYTGPTLRDVPPTVQKEDVPILCLYRDASHGLDLSLLHHIFLLEPVRDSALLDQIVSRAHRVGALQSVVVETLMPFVANPDEAATFTSFAESTSALDTKKRKKKHSIDKSQLQSSICDFCYKTFETGALADKHMLICSRNPDAQRDPNRRFTIASVFDELRPPPPF